jgi:DNA-binding CsgD family transcriptional regulator
VHGDFSMRAAIAAVGGGWLAGARAWYARVGLRSLAVLSVSVAAMAGVFAARLLLEDSPAQGVTFLLAVPIALLTLELGLAAGIAALFGAMASIALWAQLREVDLGALGYMTRFTIFGLTVALAAREHERRAARLAADAHANGAPRLTPREREVLALIAAGNTNRQAAERLALSVRTIEAHRARVQSKTGCAGRAELFRFATEHGLITAEE